MESKGCSKNDFNQERPGILPFVSIQLESEISRKLLLFQFDMLYIKKVCVYSENLLVSDMDVQSNLERDNEKGATDVDKIPVILR